MSHTHPKLYHELLQQNELIIKDYQYLPFHHPLCFVERIIQEINSVSVYFVTFSVFDVEDFFGI